MYKWYKERPPTVLPIDGGYVRPIWRGDVNNEAVFNTLMRWRVENAHTYLNQPKEITSVSFRKWMIGLLDNPQRISFLVMDQNQGIVGQLGYNNGNEIDNVLRGERWGKGLMSSAMKWILQWGEDVCFLEGIHLRVISDNEHAIKFYEKLGFLRDILIPMIRKEYDWGVGYEEGEPADKHYLRMLYKPQSVGDILTSGPSISQREVEYAADSAFQLNRNYTGYVRKLEEKACDYLGCNYAIATSSCTGAMHLALEVLGVKRGNTVAVPEITWVATAAAVAYTNAKLKFLEVDINNWGIKEQQDDDYCVIPVHLYGYPTNVDCLRNTVTFKPNKHYNKIIDSLFGVTPRGQGEYVTTTTSIRFIEDAAAAIGAEINGKKVGTYGKFGCFSFQGAKLLTASEGGLLVTNSEQLYDYAWKLNDHGRAPDRTFWIDELGFKYKMSNMQAAVALAQLERIDELLEKKRKIHDWYVEMLDGTGLVFQKSPKNHKPAHWMVSCLIPDRDRVMAELKKVGIDTRPVFPCISKYPIWGMRREPEHHPVAERIAAEGVNLPSGVTLKRRDIERVCKSLRRALNGVG